MIKCKSIYAKPTPEDGFRVLVDPLWPEGLSTRAAAVDWWARELAPSYELWRYAYDRDHWDKYRENYRRELAHRDKQAFLNQLRQRADSQMLTLVYGTDDPKRNNAMILREYLEKEMSSSRAKVS
ncbi:MAG: DUF488 family protein [candidate division KSB1 bacterium]|nr:DUF488 family protein [candidate division KSB1 bacterium]